VGIDDAGGRREQSGPGIHLWFEGQDLSPSQQGQIIHTVLFGMFPDVLQFPALVIIGGDDQFPDPFVGNVSFPAGFVEEAVSLSAEDGFQKAGGVIDPRMDHLAVPTAGFLSIAGILFHNQHMIVLCREFFRDGQPDDPGADNRYIKKGTGYFFSPLSSAYLLA
jgi:hypothetical protein